MPRPVPLGAEDIGTWLYVFTIVAFASVITNAMLLSFTMEVIPGDGTASSHVWSFISFQYGCFLTMAIVAAVVDEAAVVAVV